MHTNSRAILDIDDIFCDLIEPDSPGVAVGVVRNGEPIYTRAFGLANVEHRVANTTSTVFDIGSMTKQFTAFAILLLVRDGKLNLDDEICNFVTELPEFNPPIRIRHCLYHTCGLTDWIFALELTGPAEDYISEKRAFRTIMGLSETMFSAGQEHSYNNTGYLLLAWIVGIVAGKTLHEFLQERVFEPLRMSHATFLSKQQNLLPAMAQGYWRDEDRVLYRFSGSSDVYGDGMMHASIKDMVCWLQNLTTRTVGDAELFEMFFAPGSLDGGQKLRYAAGWELDRYRGLQAIRHGGLGNGFQSHIAWFPQANVGIAILGNMRPYLPWPMANKVLDKLVGLREDVQNSPSPQIVTHKCVNTTPADMTGRYFTATGLPVFIDWCENRLRIDIWLWRRRFERQSANAFKEPESGDAVTFLRDSTGKVTQLSMSTQDGACVSLHSPIRFAVKFENAVLESAELQRYEGRYISDELETIYRIVREGGGLRAKHMRCHDWHLMPVKSCIAAAFEGEFAQAGAWPGLVKFERNQNGDVKGFRVRGSHVNLFFRKLLPQPDHTVPC